MITVYKSVEKEWIKTNYEQLDNVTIEKGSWIHIDNPTIDILKEVSKLTAINETFLLTSLDEEESARVDVDDDDTLIVLDTPYIENQEIEKYSTAPFIIAYNKNYFVTIEKHNFQLLDEVFRRVKNIETDKHVRLTLNIVYRLSTLFISYLKRINIHTEKLETSLRNATRNKELLSLMDTNKTLIYFSTAISGNKGVLAKLIRSSTYKKYEEDADLMEDTQVEMDQANEMCSISCSVVNSMMEAFGSIINNNVNGIMKTLAVITVVLSIPTLVCSIYGMNFANIPLYDNEYGFYIAIGSGLLLAIIGLFILIFIDRFKKK